MAEAIPQSRRVLLWLMLGSLAAAAAAGVLGVLAPGTDVIWQVVGMAAVTAIGCALELAASRQIEKPTMRLGSLAAMTLVLIEYLISLLLIWRIPQNWAGYHAEETAAITMLLVAAAGIPMVVWCRLISSSQTRIAGISGLVLGGIAMAYMLIAEWALSGAVQGNHVLAAFYMELYSFPIVCCLVGVRSRRQWFAWFGVAGAVIGGYLAVCAAIQDFHGDPTPLFIWATVLAIFVAHLNVMLQASIPPQFGWLRWSTVVAVGVTGLLVGSQMINSKHLSPTGELLTRITAAAGICAGCGTVAIAIIARMNRKPERTMVAPKELDSIQLQCPGCQAKQKLPLGDSTCSECGLRFLIKVDEPRCETCGYLLYRLKSDRCPECGTPISALPAAPPLPA